MSWVTRINCPPDDSSQRIPRSIVKPIVKVVEPFVGQKLCRPIVEVRIKLVDHALIAQHRKQTDGKRCNGNGIKSVRVTLVLLFDWHIFQTSSNSHNMAATDNMTSFSNDSCFSTENRPIKGFNRDMMETLWRFNSQTRGQRPLVYSSQATRKETLCEIRNSSKSPRWHELSSAERRRLSELFNCLIDY